MFFVASGMFPIEVFYATCGITCTMLLFTILYLARWRWMMYRTHTKLALINLHSVDIPTAIEIGNDLDAPGIVSCSKDWIDLQKKPVAV